MINSRHIALARLLSFAVLVMGLIHVGATFTPLIQAPFAALDADGLKAATFMSFLCGGFFILSGWLALMLLSKANAYRFLTRPLLVIAVFDAVGGVLAASYMLHNPFAWIILILTGAALGVSFYIFRGVRN
jgi:hypothetical protein